MASNQIGDGHVRRQEPGFAGDAAPAGAHLNQAMGVRHVGPAACPAEARVNRAHRDYRDFENAIRAAIDD